MDHYERKTSVYYGILEFDLNPDTMLTVGADYQGQRSQGIGLVGQLPALRQPGATATTSPAPSTTEPSGAVGEQYTRTVFANLEHNFANGWVGKVQLDHKINGYHAPLGAIMGDWPAPDNSAKIVAQKYTGETKSNRWISISPAPSSSSVASTSWWSAPRLPSPTGRARATGTCATTTTPPTTSSTGTAI